MSANCVQCASDENLKKINARREIPNEWGSVINVITVTLVLQQTLTNTLLHSHASVFIWLCGGESERRRK